MWLERMSVYEEWLRELSKNWWLFCLLVVKSICEIVLENFIILVFYGIIML